MVIDSETVYMGIAIVAAVGGLLRGAYSLYKLISTLDEDHRESRAKIWRHLDGFEKRIGGCEHEHDVHIRIHEDREKRSDKQL